MQRVFITGITGTLGTALAKLHHSRGDMVWGCARSERTGAKWMHDNYELGTLYITDCLSLTCPDTDIGRLLHTMEVVYHCAAMKHVELCEKQPTECYWQNVSLTQVVAYACRKTNANLVFISSDKACMPESAYGASKLLAEKIVLSQGGAVVRLGNLIGSSGSVFEKWRDSLNKGEPIEITHSGMTRYFIPVEEAARFVADKSHPGSIAIPTDLKSAVIGQVATALEEMCKDLARYHDGVPAGKSHIQPIGMRPGETIHQWIIAPDMRIERQDTRILIHSDGTGNEFCQGGMNSASAQRWNSYELLRVAGVMP